MELITVDEAIRSTDTIIGMSILLIVMIAFIMWLMVISHTRIIKKRTVKQIAEAEEAIRKQCSIEAKAREDKLFRKWMDTRLALRKTTAELDEVNAAFKELSKKYDSLAETAKNCPAYGTVGKIGAISHDGPA